MEKLRQIAQIIFGDTNKKKIKVLHPLVEKINGLEADVSLLTDEALRNKTEEFKQRLQKDETLEALLPEAFAVVRESAKRTLQMRHFDVQLIGGIVLHQGNICEMKTGEGKTLVSTLPAYLNALEGKGVYIVTVNDYLARRDAEWMGVVYEFLGMSVGVIQANMSSEARVQAYQADITYGTNNEFGFDYLRDNLAVEPSQCVQYRRHYAIVDEVDSILIDEARTPLIISGPVEDSTAQYIDVARAILRLKKETHFTIDEKHKNIVLTEDGIDKLEKMLSVDNMYSLKNMALAHMSVQCLKAKYLFAPDVDYVVKDGDVVIVDEFTGRLMEGRRYSDGLHQAIEAIEGLTIKEESQTLASITFQNYFRLFPKLSGMTGTALTEVEEFQKIYYLDVLAIPTNEPMVRDDTADLIYKTKEEKYKAIVKEIQESYKKGQPVLVGTISIETSELISKLLKRQRVPHHVLNAKQHEREAEIVENAGQKGMITIATNMAGRGTDIKLGDGVIGLGGLYVIGTERHESRRIDNQLRGRSGRQGDPGKSRFYISLDDELMRLFGSERISKIMETLGLPEDTPIEHGLISKSIERAQKKVEQYYFGVRKQILQYDDVVNRQRITIYDLRHHILNRINLSTKVEDCISRLIDDGFRQYFGEKEKLTNDTFYSDYMTSLKEIFPIENLEDAVDRKSKETLSESLQKVFRQFVSQRQSQYPEGLFEEYITKRVLLETLDKKWRDQLHNLDALREGISLRSWGQKDPLIEYKMESFDMFQSLMHAYSRDSLEVINRVVIVGLENLPLDTVVDVSASPVQYNRNETPSQRVSQKNNTHKIGRNDKVTIEKNGQSQTLKWKKAEVLISEDGWKLTTVVS